MKTQIILVSFLLVFGLTSCKKDQIKAKPGASSDVAPTDDVIPPPKTIVILGSSSAAGYAVNPIDSSWANRLKSQFVTDKKKVTVINLAAIAQWTYSVLPKSNLTKGRPVPDTSRNITKALSLHPSLVLISFPTNDIAYNFTDDEIIENYAIITKLLDSAKTPYVIFGTQPRDFPILKQCSRLKTLNDELKAIYPSNYYDFLDLLSTATYSIKPELAAGDGIHLNKSGHYIIFKGLLSNTVINSIIK